MLTEIGEGEVNADECQPLDQRPRYGRQFPEPLRHERRRQKPLGTNCGPGCDHLIFPFRAPLIPAGARILWVPLLLSVDAHTKRAEQCNHSLKVSGNVDAPF